MGLPKRLGLAILSAGCVSVSAWAADIRSSLREAGMFFEPGVTYETSSLRVNYPLGSSSGDVQGFGLAARVGGHVYETLFIGLDGRYSFPTVRDGRTGLDAQSESYNWGPTIGLQMPNIGMRIWGTYVLNGTLDPDRDRGFDVKFANAEGFRLGVGFKVKTVSVNLEYQNLDYSDVVLEEAGIFSVNSDFRSVEMTNESYTASVSFPIAL